jgi:hypothetical protein
MMRLSVVQAALRHAADLRAFLADILVGHGRTPWQINSRVAILNNLNFKLKADAYCR